MTLTNIQRGDTSIYATVDGCELEFKGGECPEDTDNSCDQCGQRAVFSPATERWLRVVYCSCESPEVFLCSDCLKRGA